MSVLATALLGFALLVSIAYAGLRLVQPELAPRGFTTLVISVFLLGSLNFFGIAVVGEYVGRVLEESKNRPRFIRSLFTESGITRTFVGEGDRTA
jgi:dolichol-phosphate mannosyltransferase